MSAGRIRKLSAGLINRIAAGEVVERPASVVKELVENSIDAEASRIEITLEDGGKRLIRVADNGRGMVRDDLLLACESHATSKLPEADDLFAIHTLGFRGEALASIGSVSHFRLVSRARGAEAGAAVECNGGRRGEVQGCGAPEGTIIEVRDLFFNTPARLKFLRSTATELRHAMEAVTRLTLPYPGVGVQLAHNGRTSLKLERCGTERERLGALFGDALCAELVPVHSESAAMTVTGYVGAPGGGRSSSAQYVFVNGRYIRDRAIHRAVAEAYRNRMPRGRYPVVCLYLQMDPARVDVNVHPTKVEVRFRDSGAVFAQVLTALERSLSVAGPRAVRARSREPGEGREGVGRAMADFFDRSPAAERSAAGAPAGPRLAPGGGREAEPTPARERQAEPTVPAQSERARLLPEPAAQARPSRRCFQLHQAYIVEETADGFLLIDQHALHERILYEELCRRRGKSSVPRQRLLVPELIDVRPSDFLRVMELREELRRLGVEIEAFGEKTVAVQAVPHLAGEVNARELVLEIVRDLEEAPAGGAPEREDVILKTIACKAAVKAGERLSRTQMEALLDERDRLGREPTCPHGRPTTLHFPADELEKMFHRK